MSEFSAPAPLRFMSGRLATGLVLVSILSLLALLVVSAFAPVLRVETSNGNTALSESATGFAGLGQLLQLTGIPVAIDHGPWGRHGPPPSLTILTPDLLTRAQDVALLAASGPVLIILPKWTDVAMPEKRSWIMKTGIVPAGLLGRPLNFIAGSVQVSRRPGDTGGWQLTPESNTAPAMPAAPLATIEELQTVKGALLMPILDARPYGSVLAAVRRRGNPVYILSDPDLMNNHGLRDETTARSALAIIRWLRRGNGPVSIDVTLNGFSYSPSLLLVAFQAPFLGATITALFAAVLIGIHAASRFGPSLRAGRIYAPGKKALADNSADLVRMMGREGAMARRYVLASRDMVLKRLGRSTEQAAWLASMEQSDGDSTSYHALTREALEARDGTDLLRIAKKSYAWRQGITHEH